MAKTANYSTRITEEFKANLDIAEKNFASRSDFISALFSLYPIYQVIQEKGLTLEDALNRLNSESVITEVKVIRKGINEIEFSNWFKKLIAHNESSSNEDKVYITQNLFLDLIGGNVNSLTKLYKENETAIMEHNEKMGIDKNQNRKLSSRIRETHGNVVNWIKSKTA